MAGTCGALVVASTPTGPTGIHILAIDATSVYVTNYGTGGGADGTLVKAPLGGGAPTTLASGLANPLAMALSSTTVYWVNNAFGSANGSVNAVPIAGGSGHRAGLPGRPRRSASPSAARPCTGPSACPAPTAR